MDNIIDELIENAKSEKWSDIDSKIPTIIQNPQYIKWAHDTALTEINKHVKNLGARILEKATINESEFKEMRERLYQRMTMDISPQVRFRSAFALAAHGTGRYTAEVIAILNIALHDKDVGEIAKTYLDNLNK
jgi:hypothetical protein